MTACLHEIASIQRPKIACGSQASGHLEWIRSTEMYLAFQRRSAALHLVISNVHSSICDAVHFECNEVVGQLEPYPAIKVSTHPETPKPLPLE